MPCRYIKMGGIETMTRYGMVIDTTKCNGCYNCFLACRDEFCGNEYPPYSAGGVSKHTYFLVNHLKKIGVNCRVLSFGYPNDSSNEVTFIEPNSSVSIHKSSLRENLNIFSDIKTFLLSIEYCKIPFGRFWTGNEK